VTSQCLTTSMSWPTKEAGIVCSFDDAFMGGNTKDWHGRKAPCKSTMTAAASQGVWSKSPTWENLESSAENAASRFVQWRVSSKAAVVT
jgi:hypothetical protein